MLPSRFAYLLVLFLAVHAWCKPAKSTEQFQYSDDDPPSDYNDDDTPPDDDDALPDEDDNAGAFEEPPQIISKPKVIHEKTGSTIKLPCLVKNTENFAVTWKKDNEFLYSDANPITSDSKRIVRLSDNSLVIYNATVADSSNNYECSILSVTPIVLVHRVLIDPDRAPVTPPTQPHKSVIQVTPSPRVEITAGGSVTLGCETTIQPPPKIKWFHKNQKVDSKLIVDENHIRITNANRHDAGHYQCLAEDKSEHPPIGAITVVVDYPPVAEVKKDLVHSGIGVESVLTCIVYAHPHAKVAWYKDSKPIMLEKGRVTVRNNKTSHNLEILRTEAQDFGLYECEAVNSLGQAKKSILLIGAPSRAVIFDGERTKTDTGLTLKWRLESYSPITEYKLEYRIKDDEKWMMVQPTVKNGKGIQFTVEYSFEGLQPTSYVAILTSKNAFGWSPPSAPYTFIGEFAVGEAENVQGSAATSQPLGALIALFLVVSSCAFTSL